MTLVAVEPFGSLTLVQWRGLPVYRVCFKSCGNRYKCIVQVFPARRKGTLSVNAPNYIQVEHWQVSSDYSKVNLKSANLLLKNKKLKMLIS